MPMDEIGIVINYYWLPTYPKSCQISTWGSLSNLMESCSIHNVVLVDGSPTPDAFISSKCLELGIEYISSGRGLRYAEGFNLGIERLQNPYICLMANDIFPTQDVFDKLYKCISVSDVGCVFPYLSYSDYPGQMPSFVRMPVTCEPTVMTLNMNLFRRSALEKIGGIDEKFTGSFNDVIALAKIRNHGYRAILVGDTNVTHMGRLTISQGSNYRKDNDYRRFSDEFPQYRAEHGKWQIKHWIKPFATNRKIAALWWISQNAPSTRVRRFLEWMTIWLEPELTKV